MIDRNQINPKGSYLLSGETLIHLLSPARWVDGVVGEIAITEHPNGSISVGFERSEFAYVVVNGELRACMVPICFINDPAGEPE